MEPLTVRLPKVTRRKLDRIRRRKRVDRGDVLRAFLEEKGFNSWLESYDRGTT